jgi:hypothetical protein
MQWIEQKGTGIPKSLRSVTFPNTQQEIICMEKEGGSIQILKLKKLKRDRQIKRTHENNTPVFHQNE